MDEPVFGNLPAHTKGISEEIFKKRTVFQKAHRMMRFLI